MNHQLILVEGLPGSGKTTTAKLVQKILEELGTEPKLFLEGDLDHPADFESVACLNEDEYYSVKHLLSDVRKEGSDYLIPYRKLGLQMWSNKDIYELPFEKNQELIVQNWGRFAENSDGIHIFECCFIQNPVTVGMIKYGVSDEQVIDYVRSLEEKVAGLNPLLIYIEPGDIEATLLNAIEERPQEWSQFFTEYYTSQGYGKAHQLEGILGTVEVLKARHELEKKIIEQLQIPKVVIKSINDVTRLLKEALL